MGSLVGYGPWFAVHHYPLSCKVVLFACKLASREELLGVIV